MMRGAERGGVGPHPYVTLPAALKGDGRAGEASRRASSMSSFAAAPS
jgi:hypothetical protein